MQQGLTEIVFLLDRSGSMQPLIADVVGSFDQFVVEQQAQPGAARFSLVLFDTRIETAIDRQPLAKVTSLAGRYQPSGGTALLDALGETITRLGQVLAGTPEPERPEQVIFVVLTDGEENSSREYRRGAIKKMIERQQRQYSWKFVYLGANQDAFAEAGAIGIQAAQGFAADAKGVRAAYSVSSRAVSSYRAGRDGAAELRRKKSPVN